MEPNHSPRSGFRQRKLSGSKQRRGQSSLALNPSIRRLSRLTLETPDEDLVVSIRDSCACQSNQTFVLTIRPMNGRREFFYAPSASFHGPEVAVVTGM